MRRQRNFAVSAGAASAAFVFTLTTGAAAPRARGPDGPRGRGEVEVEEPSPLRGSWDSARRVPREAANGAGLSCWRQAVARTPAAATPRLVANRPERTPQRVCPALAGGSARPRLGRPEQNEHPQSRPDEHSASGSQRAQRRTQNPAGRVSRWTSLRPGGLSWPTQPHPTGRLSRLDHRGTSAGNSRPGRASPPLRRTGPRPAGSTSRRRVSRETTRRGASRSTP